MTVASLIADARTYSSTLVTGAGNALDNAISAVADIGIPFIGSVDVGTPRPPVLGAALIPPRLAPIGLNLPAEPPNALSFQDIAAIEVGALPPFTAIAPTLTLPSAPAQLPAFPASAPGINTNIAFPEPPSALLNPLIAAPVLPDRVAPSSPEVSLPVFGALAPTDNTVAPANLEGRFDSAYRTAAPSTIAMLDGYVDAQILKYNPRYSEQMAKIEDQLAAYLKGGTALASTVENAIYERARSKSNAESRRTRDAAFSDAAARGFTLPTGALYSAMQQARQGAADNNAAAGREIVVMQAEMEQKNLQFAVTTSAGLRQTMLSAALSYHQNLISINGQALDYAKSILSAIVETYNVAVKAYGVKLDGYKAEAVVYETRLRSAMAGIELYKVQIDALQALTSVDRAKVEVYRARIDALTALSNVYRAQIEAVQGRASLEKLKIDLFQSQVQAYSAQVQGKNAEYQGYTAAIEGQVAKVKIFGAQVESFNAQVQGFKATIDAKAEVVRASVATNQARATQYSATLSGYSAVVQARGDVARTQLENQRQEVVAFQATAQAQVAQAQVQAEYYKAGGVVAVEQAKLLMQTIIANADVRVNYGKTISQLHSANATIHGNLASAALSGMNSLATESKAE